MISLSDAPHTRPEFCLQSDRLLLRRVVAADAKGPYTRWMNDPAVMRFLETRFESHTAEDIARYVDATAADPRNVFLAIVLKTSGDHVGNIKLGPINERHRLGDVGVLIGEKQGWGKGVATEAIGLLSDYAFDTLHLHKLTAGCYGNHAGSARAFEKAGFIIEARRPAHYLCEGEWVDSILLRRINPSEETEG